MGRCGATAYLKYPFTLNYYFDVSIFLISVNPQQAFKSSFPRRRESSFRKFCSDKLCGFALVPRFRGDDESPH